MAVGTLGEVRALGFPCKKLGGVLPPGLPVLGLRERRVIRREFCQGLSGVWGTPIQADLGVSAEMVCMAALGRNFTFPPVPSAMEVIPGKRSSCICSRGVDPLTSPMSSLET